MADRGHWGSRIGFVLAAAGSAVGLGNIWKFPYITGVNGGGAFVLVYLACIVLVGLPVMIAEILMGRATQKSPVGAFKELGGGRWVAFGWLGVAAAFVILFLLQHCRWLGASLHLPITDGTDWRTRSGSSRPGIRRSVHVERTEPFWHVVFMAITVGVVWGGVRKGIERWARILMPTLFALMVILLVNSFTMEGFSEAADFVFGFHTESLTAAGVLEALGHAFFTLSIGMGAMLTYGSYLKSDDDIVSAAITVSVLDAVIALLACMVLFPIIFSFGLEPGQGPGLVFVSMPIALSQMGAGTFFSLVFFALLFFAALTSAISLLEVAVSYLIDEKGWLRRRAVLLCGGIIAGLGIPSALSGGTALFGESFAGVFGRNWFDTFDYLATNWILPLGGLGMAVFTAWRLDDAIRRREFLAGSKLAFFYKTWLLLLKFVVPVGIVLVFLHAIGVI